MKRWVLVLGLIIVLTGITATMTGCGGPKGPGEVVEAFWTALKKGDPDKAQNYITMQARVDMPFLLVSAGVQEKFLVSSMDELKIDSIRITQVEIQDNKARVSYVLYWQGRDSDAVSGVRLIETERDVWKINENILMYH